MVERTAHNGLVVGSNPTKPKFKIFKMKILPKIYKLNKNKNYIKTNNLLFFLNGTNIKSNDWIKTEQNLKNYNFNYYKIFNRSVLITLNKSIYCNIKSSIISSLILFATPEQNAKILNKKIVNKLELLNFIVLSLSLNNKIYSVITIKKINSFVYYSNKLLLYKFLVINLKKFNKKLSISK